jgi:hypothetical protein
MIIILEKKTFIEGEKKIYIILNMLIITPIGVPPIRIDGLISLLIKNSNLMAYNERCRHILRRSLK